MENPLAFELAESLRTFYPEFWSNPFCLQKNTLNDAAPATGEKDVVNRLAEEIRFCQKCQNHIGRSHSVWGRGETTAPLAFIGDFPSHQDDAIGSPFSDEAGELLHKMIAAMHLSPESLYITTLLKCRPPMAHDPSENEYLACSHYLRLQFQTIRAPFVVALGENAAKFLTRTDSSLAHLRKQEFSWENRRLFCTHHPRDLLLQPTKKKEAWEDLQRVMRAMGIQQ